MLIIYMSETINVKLIKVYMQTIMAQITNEVSVTDNYLCM